MLSLEKFDPKTKALQEIVAGTKEIVDIDLEDKKQLEKVKKARIALRDERVEISSIGKKYREETTAFNKAVIVREKELLEIITPEENRLKEIEEQAKKLKIRKERVAVLPMRKEKLETIGDDVDTSEGNLLEMDDTEFIDYYNTRVTEKNRLESEALAKQKAEQDAIEEKQRREKEIEEAKEKARQEERDRIEAEANKKEEVKEPEPAIEEETKEEEIKHDTGHIELVNDLSNLSLEAQRYEFHDFKNENHAVPKIALVRRLEEIIEKTKNGDYDN